MDSYHSVRDVRFNQQRVGQTRNDRVPREKLFACTYCGKVFNRPKKVVIHQRIHTGEKPFKCNTCGKFFAEAGNLRKHQKVHTGERPYSCSQCGQTFEPYTVHHKQETKGRRKSYVCKYCGKAFPGLSNVVAHQRVHTGERPFKCDTCGKLFTEAGNLKKHQRVHTGEKPFICPRCGKRFAWICNLKTHQQSACWLPTHASYEPSSLLNVKAIILILTESFTQERKEIRNKIETLIGRLSSVD
uniref:C2H2-type domain-containing protein n=1 Tax=Cyprinus carpio TaxID=7962 RepID=A0A8C2Q233_CYPCA